MVAFFTIVSVSAPSGSSFALVVLLFEATYFLELLVWVVLSGTAYFVFGQLYI